MTISPNKRTPYQYLPLFAKLAIERLDADSALRTPAMLAELVEAYAKTYGTKPDDDTHASALYICVRRFGMVIA